jgi:hypothetical protein
LADASPALATPIQSYDGQAWLASKVSPTIALPGPSSGSHATARAWYE